ncbi:ATP-binding protein, partial [Kineococcus glutinatus]|uniref:ATP-binding protein n=1 Tax=Kineococcus glutinatus TaxID=1070872 RepID=UPI0031ECB0B7
MTTAAVGGIVGREAEAAELAARLAAARAGSGGLVLVSGPAGIGKTALVEALAAGAGVPVVRGRAWDGGAPPLWPWQPLLDVLGDGAGAGDPQATAATAAATAADAAALRFARLQRLATAVLERGPAAGPLLVLEDLHQADALSLDLLRAVTARAAGSALLVVATHRDVP